MGAFVNPFWFDSGGAPISFVGGKVIQANTSAVDLAFDFTGLSGGSDSSPSVGDMFVIILSGGGNNAVARDLNPQPAGTVARVINRTVADSFDASLGVWWGIYEAGSATGGTWDFASTPTAIILSILVFRNTDTLDVAAVEAFSANSNETDPPAITPVTAGAWILSVAMVSHRTSGALADPSDMTVLQNVVQSGFRSNSLVTAIKTDWSSGSFDPAAYPAVGPGGDAALSSWVAATLALRPS